jgi:hypothetical protein
MSSDQAKYEARERKALQRSMQRCGVLAGFSPVIAGLMARDLIKNWKVDGNGTNPKKETRRSKAWSNEPENAAVNR